MMTDTFDPESVEEGWTSFVQRMNEEFLDAFEQNLEAQAEFVESWSEAVESQTDDERITSGARGYARAYQVWMDAAEQMVGRTNDAIEGEEVGVEDFRDIWLNSANEAFKEVMGTTAFAAATGDTLDQVFDAQQQATETAEATLRSLGMPTESDVEEVGERLVELERRQHDVENKLDRILEQLEE